MLPGIDEIFARFIYLILYGIGSLMWNIARVLLAVAHFIQSVQAGIIDNIGLFVQYTVNALSAPVGMFLVLAMAALGSWYLLNNITALGKWVDPGRLLTYGLATLVFFSAPVLVIDTLESVRTSMTQGIEATILDDAIAEMLTIETGAEDNPLPDSIPDVNSDGMIGTFDLAAYFLSISNVTEVYNGAFPDAFAEAYFPDSPTEVDLTNEDERNEAIQDSQDGITRLFFSFVAIPTAIAEHFLWFVLTIAAVFLYIGFPIAAALSFFVYTDALFTAYVRQFIKLCIETFISVIIVSFVVGLIAAAAQASTGLFIGTCFIGTIILLWRIKGAMKLSTAAFDMFGGGTLTGGATGKDFRTTATTAMVATAAAVTGGVSMAAVGAMALDNKTGESLGLSDGTMDRSLMGLDRSKSDARAQQLVSLAGYSGGKIPGVRAGIETAHEGRAFMRGMRDGGPGEQSPDALDYFRVGSSLSTFGSSPWLAMRTSPSLRRAFDNIGGSANRAYRADDGAPLGSNGLPQDQLTAVLQQLLSVLQGNPSGPGPGSRSAPQPGASPTTPSEGHRTPPSAFGAGAAAMPPPPENFPSESASGRMNEAAETPASPVDVNGVSSNPDLDGNPGDDRAEGQTLLQDQSEARTASLIQTVGTLDDPASFTGQQSQQLLSAYIGPQNTEALTQATHQHGPEAVQTATQATADVVADYQTEGMDGAAILTAFQSGAGFDAVRNQIEGDTPLSDGQLTAVADMVLMPRRDVVPAQLDKTIAEMVGSGGTDREAAAKMGVVPHFGQATGAIRGTIQGAQEMGLSQVETTQLLADLRQGLVADVQSALAATGASATTINHFISDASMLPTEKFQISQSTAPQEGEQS